MAKGKKKKDKKDKGSAGKSTARKLKDLSRNPLVADLVAAVLVSAAAALKDSKKARRLASDAGDELEKLAASGADRGGAMWQLALDVGRKSLEAFAGDAPKASKSTAAKKASRSAKPRAAKDAAKTRGAAGGKGRA